MKNAVMVLMPAAIEKMEASDEIDYEYTSEALEGATGFFNEGR